MGRSCGRSSSAMSSSRTGTSCASGRSERKGGRRSTATTRCCVFGGDQNVGEEVSHPWLHDEYDAMRRWVDDGTPLFARLSRRADARARARGRRRARCPAASSPGFYETELTAAGVDDPVLGVLPRTLRGAERERLRASRCRRAPSSSRRGPVRAGVPRRRARLGGAVPSRGAARPGARLVRGGRAAACPKPARRARAGDRREARRVAGARRAALPRVPRGRDAVAQRSSGRSSWRDHSCHEPT